MAASSAPPVRQLQPAICLRGRHHRLHHRPLPLAGEAVGAAGGCVEGLAERAATDVYGPAVGKTVGLVGGFGNGYDLAKQYGPRAYRATYDWFGAGAY